MKNKIVWSLLVASLAWLAGMGAATAEGDPDAGKKKFYTCVGCHGVPGYTNVYPTYHVPRLGGQHAAYVVSALKAYQTDQRKHLTMHGNSANLTEQDLQDIAAFVSKFRGLNVSLPVTVNVEAGKQKAAACASCHGEDGNGGDGNFPRLAGQYESYIVKALEDYKSGARNNPIMAGFASGLSAKDMKDIAAYYASQSRGLTLAED